MIIKSQHAPRVARPGEEAGRCQNITCHVIRAAYVVIHDFIIIDQWLGAERQQLMLAMLFTALFVEENRQMETKHIWNAICTKMT